MLFRSRTDGYLAKFDMHTGHEWKPDLVDALEEAQVLVSMYSPSYFRSDYCGKEMQVYLARRKLYIEKNVGKRPANIIPVCWHPPLRIPKTFPSFQYKLPAEADKDKGVWKIREDGRIQDFHNVAEDAAIQVRDALAAFEYNPLQPSPQRPGLDAIDNAFAPPLIPLREFDSVDGVAGPDSATFVYASSPALEAWPYPPAQVNMVLRVASSIAKGKEIEPQQLAFDPTYTNLSTRLKTAWQRNSRVIVFVDAGSLSADALRARMREYDEGQFKTFSTMILWNNNRTAPLEKVVGETFPFFSSRQPPFFHSSIESAEQFENAIESTLEKLKWVILKDPYNPHPTDDPSLPVISGPGGAT